MPRAPRRCPGDRGNCETLIRPGQKYCDQHDTHNWPTERTPSSQITKTYDWQRLRKLVLERDHYQCQIRYPDICTGRATTVDKIQPAARRPDLALDPSNCRAACSPCNDKKGRTEDKQPR